MDGEQRNIKEFETQFSSEKFQAFCLPSANCCLSTCYQKWEAFDKIFIYWWQRYWRDKEKNIVLLPLLEVREIKYHKKIESACN